LSVRADGADLAVAPPRAHGGPLGRATFKLVPADFCVEERLGFAADGGAGHVLIKVEKVGLDTHAVVPALARLAGCPPRDVGYAGLKDRQARTRQWFTVPARGRSAAAWAGEGEARTDGAGWRVLEAAPHSRKLRRGALKGNRFEILLRDVDADPAAIGVRLATIAVRGVPNYFGPQRFGRDQSNLVRVAAFAAGAEPPRDHRARGFLYSAARSLVFNAVLAERVAGGSWESLLGGEWVNLDGSRSYFVAGTVDEVLVARLRAGDVHPTGPLAGSGDAPGGAAGELESAVLGRYEALVGRLQDAGLEAGRRALRVVPRDLEARFDDGALALGFSLVAGAYATTVLAELFTLDAMPPGESEADEA
jgi:tRNA pseudouridine13 synthase